eukprot:gnl/MRDRNA2_/MRDRNA2_90158_c0_seq1.p1 gnl/MRDRNA2_/MRDRNA2_90158_c0~~gnl/MRDRNA2_/MRDRNA2_90158_c0_seq1.p1  ORF type:complete len:250 (+),score=50.80 gnl/MRDRNA2_/MRDRNA2_90158_c0_seq1:103-852(+)
MTLLRLVQYAWILPGILVNAFAARGAFRQGVLKNISTEAQPSWVPKVYGRSAFAAKLPKSKTYVELGVYRGDFSKLVWTTAAPEKMVLIDPWEVADNSSVPGVEYDGKTANGESKMAYSKSADMQHVQSIFKNEIAAGKVELKRGFSYDFVDSFGAESIDILYIDACHMYECVRRDMNDYFPRVKLNGYMCGHDYCADGTGGSSPGQCGAMWKNGVTRAVDEFVAQRGSAVAWLFLNPTENDWCLLRKS